MTVKTDETGMSSQQFSIGLVSISHAQNIQVIAFSVSFWLRVSEQKNKTPKKKTKNKTIKKTTHKLLPAHVRGWLISQFMPKK